MSDFSCDFYITGVGGQGIGLLSETLLRGYDHAGLPVLGVDTHGLAQRGGVVVSHVRVGKQVFSPLIEPGKADIVIALERTEALRGMNIFLKRGGTLIYYDASWQPLPVRLQNTANVSEKTIRETAIKKEVRVVPACYPDLPNIRMQNTALLSEALLQQALPHLELSHLKAALEDLLSGNVLEENLRLLENKNRYVSEKSS